ncbi:MAG TPA: NUDIX hydrolase [Spirochaetota bacterium]|nr:NUDIX hydrolase [Spirochaetota bacterium]HPR49489.1 NUDIX hydrolase [Spirochaetota bacterium]
MSLSKDVRVRVAGILIENDKLLLIAHKKENNIYWLLPGGGVNYGESLSDALKREFLEELNISVENHEILLVFDSIDPSGERHVINICFHCAFNSGAYRLGKDERLHDYSFFSIEELSKISMYPPINDSLKSIMKKNINNIYLGSIWLDK